MLLNLLGQNARIIGWARYFFWIRNHVLTLRIGLIALCLGLTVASASLIAQKGPEIGILPIVFILAVAVVLFIYYNLELTLLITVVISTVFYTGIFVSAGTAITITFAMLVLIPLIWLFKTAFIDRSLRLRSIPVNLPAMLFVITVVVATMWSGALVDDDVRYLFMDKVNPRIMTAMTLIVSVLTYLTFANLIRSIRSIRFFVWWFIATGTVFAAVALSGIEVPTFLNLWGQFPTWVIILALGQALFNRELSSRIQVLCVVLSAVWLYISFAGISWLSGWLPSLVGGAVLAFLRSRKLFIVLLIVIAVAGVLKADSFAAILDAENSESGVARTNAWNKVFDLIKEHPLLGMGPAGYHYYFTSRIDGRYQLSHNNYVDIVAQTGIVGFVFYVWMWLAMGWMTLRMYRTAPRQGFRYGLAVSLVAAYFVSIVTMMLGDWITPFPYTQGLTGIDYTIWHWMMAGLTAALYFESRQSEANQMGLPMMTPSHTLPAQADS